MERRKSSLLCATSLFFVITAKTALVVVTVVRSVCGRLHNIKCSIMLSQQPDHFDLLLFQYVQACYLFSSYRLLITLCAILRFWHAVKFFELRQRSACYQHLLVLTFRNFWHSINTDYSISAWHRACVCILTFRSVNEWPASWSEQRSTGTHWPVVWLAFRDVLHVHANC